jgi:CheY-like chemotaxis protein
MQSFLTIAEVPASRFPIASDQLASYFQPLHKSGSRNASIFNSSVNSQSKRKPVALIVDDVADVTDMLSVFLTHAGYEVITADSAAAAIIAAENRHFDVVVSDIGMPEMNGYELAQRLRSMPGYEAVPLIAITGFSMYDDRERSLQCGFDAHLTKPLDLAMLYQLVERLRG